MHQHFSWLLLGYYGPVWEPIARVAGAVGQAVAHFVGAAAQQWSNNHCDTTHCW